MKKKERTPEEKAELRAKQKENLMDVNVLNSSKTPEERKEVARKGGIASGEKRRANRMMMDLAKKILEMPVSDAYQNMKVIMARYGIPEDEMNYAAAIMANMAVKAVSGDVNAAKFVRDSAGFDSLTVLKEEQFEYMKENGTNLNVNLDGKLEEDVHIYLPDNGRPVVGDK